MPRKRNVEKYRRQHSKLRDLITQLGRFNKKALEVATSINRRMLTDHLTTFIRAGEVYAETPISRKTYYISVPYRLAVLRREKKILEVQKLREAFEKASLRKAYDDPTKWIGRCPTCLWFKPTPGPQLRGNMRCTYVGKLSFTGTDSYSSTCDRWELEPDRSKHTIDGNLVREDLL
jgi:hypothetical protein